MPSDHQTTIPSDHNAINPPFHRTTVPWKIILLNIMHEQSANQLTHPAECPEIIWEWDMQSKPSSQLPLNQYHLRLDRREWEMPKPCHVPSDHHTIGSPYHHTIGNEMPTDYRKMRYAAGETVLPKYADQMPPDAWHRRMRNAKTRLPYYRTAVPSNHHTIRTEMPADYRRMRYNAARDTIQPTFANQDTT